MGGMAFSFKDEMPFTRPESKWSLDSEPIPDILMPESWSLKIRLLSKLKIWVL